MFECYLCLNKKRAGYGGYYCDACNKIGKIIECYGSDEVLDILEQTCLRKDKKLRDIKIEKVKKDKEEDKKVDIDKAHGLAPTPPPPPTTRSQKKKTSN
tara:strand:- start:24 stop:320 length:297 start_codon:yes stop_codon:yes gene_type:complete